MGAQTPYTANGRRRTRPDAHPRTSFLERAHHPTGVPTERGLTAPRVSCRRRGGADLRRNRRTPGLASPALGSPRVVSRPVRTTSALAVLAGRLAGPLAGPRRGSARGHAPPARRSGPPARRAASRRGRRRASTTRRRAPWRDPASRDDRERPDGRRRPQAKRETHTVSRRSFCARSLTAGAASGSRSIRRKFQIATSPFAASRASGASFARSRTDARIARAPA